MSNKGLSNVEKEQRKRRFCLFEHGNDRLWYFDPRKKCRGKFLFFRQLLLVLLLASFESVLELLRGEVWTLLQQESRSALVDEIA